MVLWDKIGRDISKSMVRAFKRLVAEKESTKRNKDNNKLLNSQRLPETAVDFHCEIPGLQC